ncbi:TetR/AcrR family transcriptional regulator [Acetobacter oeni]|uniref:TetR family transcriptional regulator n=1 Tax=Acetobacter oeni TaxID=304077 RepID=A0A511XQW9_9PROT|nr:TetR/AcrR family transcriptional regulator [Acetobacter oeni]MBB3883733.1 AcrR family transcriptional regulator [Acetobacter oeni]GBR10231.1 TetR family transcriptional regulator [Acetobacter oeni LMG 21952]GEN65368.1 TetR family transcriptional regulator [Acetobacter oeni]
MDQSSRKLSRNEQQQETRTALIVSALHLFARYGFDGTSIQAIAKEAGFTRGAFYAHFASKHEILDAAIAERDALDRQRLSAKIDTLPTTRATVSAWIADSQRADLPLGALRLEVIRHSLGSTDLAQLLLGNQRAEVEGIRTILVKMANDLPLRQGISAPIAAQIISSFLDGVAIHALIDKASDVHALWNALILGLTADDTSSAQA